MTTRDDDTTRYADGGHGLNLSRREMVKGAGALAVGAAVGATATLAGRAARARRRARSAT